MHRSGHFGAALLFYAPLFSWLLSDGRYPAAFVGLVAASKVAMLPDCDHRLPRISHRTYTHTLPFVALVSLFTALVVAVPFFFLSRLVPFFSFSSVFVGAVTTAVCLSLLSHLAADLITPDGVSLFWPLRWNVRKRTSLNRFFPFCKAASPFYNSLFLLLGTFAVIATGYIHAAAAFPFVPSPSVLLESLLAFL